MRRIAKILVLATALVAGMGAGQAPPPRHIEFSAEDRATLDKISDYLNGTRSLQGDFVQIAPNGGMDQGKFYLVKPGKIRFEYRPPSPLLVVSDGRTVGVFNSKLKTVDRYPLSSTPLDLLLGDKIDLRKNDAILAVQHRDGNIIVEARTATKRTKANIAITFSESPLALRQWTIIDDQGLPTTVAVRNLQDGGSISDQLFVLRDAKPAVGIKSRD
ncbi:outer membrane lipoprotein-sorting protein [Rhizomicrobium palustre]|uniref:Outer membrane lipoprotein-sorting protein n=1 Tax=Rhizomicrobium palustre TaxID=189966 RepID=A0A846N0A5_9PROT|nr:outer-membrane lipoprotein carrier protein LolA [Rhizomicrobium palustre]NIK88620.1 outer membrane lipoprotein-sorting protein [Rhizomicrobium palustre]